MDYQQFYNRYGEFNLQLDRLSEPSYTVTYAWSKTKRKLENLLQSEINQRLQTGGTVKVADLGCGDGALLIHTALVNQGTDRITYTGYDLSTAFVEFGNFAATAKGVEQRMQFKALNIETDPLAEGEYDVIVSSEVLEHLTNPGETLAKIYQALKPGGVVLISTPNSQNLAKYPLHPLKKLFQRGNQVEISKKLAKHEQTYVLAEEEQHLHVFYHRELKQLLEEAGFNRVEFFRSSLVFGGPLLDKWRILFSLILVAEVVLDWLNAFTFGWDIILKATKPE